MNDRAAQGPERQMQEMKTEDMARTTEQGAAIADAPGAGAQDADASGVDTLDVDVQDVQDVQDAEAPDIAAPGVEDELNNRLFFRLLQAGNIYERKAQQELGFSGIQGALLGALCSGPAQGIPLSELVEYLAVSRQNLDGVLKRLEKHGYVERVEAADNRRIRIVRITRAGRRAWARLFVHSLEFYRQGTRDVPLDAKRLFVNTLVGINRSLRSISLESDAKSLLRGPESRIRAAPARRPGAKGRSLKA